MTVRQVILLTPFILFFSCTDSTEQDPEALKLHFSLDFDDSLPRLGNLGQPAPIPAGHAGQNPEMQEVSLHYIEFAPTATTPLTSGQIVYQGEETFQGGDRAVDFKQADIGRNNERFASVDLSSLAPGTYEWVRVSLTYQKYEIDYRLNTPPTINNEDFKGSIASFVGFNTYIEDYTLVDSTISLNQNKVQGYWAFETNISVAGFDYGHLSQGDGAGVTVVNPIESTSPIPAGSCVVTGQFAEPLVITGNEDEDLEVMLTFSINNSFEWKEVIMDGKYEPGAGETVVDMGLRGLYPSVQ